MLPVVRSATKRDLDAVRRIYNEGIADRIATLDTESKSADDMAEWWANHTGRYVVLVAEDRSGTVLGWASLNPYSHRCAHRGVADLSVYVGREYRGSGIGSMLLAALENTATASDFHKIVLFALATNTIGQRLYRKSGYAEVGVFREHGQLDGTFVDVLAMEKILRPL
jgi:phosphinothricin acetyltransferase